MKSNLVFFCIGSFLLLFACSSRNEVDPKRMQALQSALSNQINRTLASDLYNGVEVGLLIQTVDGKVLFSREADQPHVTASVFKIIPSGVALEKFGPHKRFETWVGADAEPELGVIEGNLYLVGRGDPSLSRGDLAEMAKKVFAKGVREIKQDLVYDDSYFDSEKSRFGNNARNLYAPPSALTVDYGWIDVKVTEGPPVTLELVPKSGYARITSQLTWSSEDVWGRPLLTLRQKEWGDEFSVVGTLARKDRQYHYLHLGVSRPSLYAATIFKEELERLGIVFKGTIRSGRMPRTAKVLQKHEGLPLAEIVRVMNQESNNVIAEMINKSLGAEFVSLPGTREKGLSVLRAFLVSEMGFPEGSFSIGDSSGLSTDNRLSARQVCKVLGRFYAREKTRSAFVPTLARQGHHPHAMNPVPPDSIKVYVKTGTLSVQGVNSIAGYCMADRTGEIFTFAILASRKKTGPMTYSGTLTNPLVGAMVKAFGTALEDKQDDPSR